MDATFKGRAKASAPASRRRLVLALPMAGLSLAVGDSLVTPRNPAWMLFLPLCAVVATALAWALANDPRFHLVGRLEHHATRNVSGAFGA